MRLTDLSIRKLPLPPKGQKTYFEGGFGVRVSQGGSKTFVVMHGKKRKLTSLGRYPDLALKDARRLAHRVLDTPPVIPSKKPEDAISAFLEHVERNNKPRTHKDYKRLLKRFPTSFDRPTIITTLKAFRNTPGELSHITTAFQVFLNWCVNNGYLEQNPIVGLKNQGRIKKRDRILSDDELKAIWSALGDDRFENIVRILMLTGLRRGEAQHIVVDDDTASIPAEHTKNGREHVFPLGELSKQYVTPITFGGWGKSKKRLDDACGVSDWTLHDLRRTFASNHARLGTPIHIIERLLNHVSGSLAGVAGIYNRYQYLDEKRVACDNYENWLASILDP